MSNWNNHLSVVYITLNAARLLRESLDLTSGDREYYEKNQ